MRLTIAGTARLLDDASKLKLNEQAELARFMENYYKDFVVKQGNDGKVALGSEEIGWVMDEFCKKFSISQSRFE